MLVLDFLLLHLSFGLIKFLEHLDVLLHIENFASPFGNDDSCLLLTDCHLASHVFDHIFVLLLPVTLHFAVQVLTQLKIYFMLVENSFEEGFEDVNEMNLSNAMRVDFDFEISQQFEGVNLLHDYPFFVIHKVSVLLPQSSIFLVAGAVISIIKLNPNLPPSQRWWQLIEQKDEIVNGDPASSLGVIVLPEVDERFDLISLHDTHVFLLGGVQSFDDGGHREIHDQQGNQNCESDEEWIR